jgi:transcriptional regulator
MTPDKSDVLYGTLGLIVIKTLEALGPLHGYRIARRIEQISGNQLVLNQGTLYPALLKLEQMGWISSRWGTSESGRRVRIYALMRAGRKQLHNEEAQWQRAASIVERFLKIKLVNTRAMARNVAPIGGSLQNALLVPLRMPSPRCQDERSP